MVENGEVGEVENIIIRFRRKPKQKHLCEGTVSAKTPSTVSRLKKKSLNDHLDLCKGKGNLEAYGDLQFCGWGTSCLSKT